MNKKIPEQKKEIPNDFYEKVKNRLVYHVVAPLFFIVVLGLIFRYGFSDYSGEMAVTSMLLFLAISITSDHKELTTNFVVWNLLRVVFYTTVAVGFAIFMREIGDFLFT